MANGVIQNPFNLILRQRAAALKQAYRGPIAPGCVLPANAPPPTAPETKSLLHVPFVAQAIGDYELIPSLIGRKFVYEIVLWNVAAQTIGLYQGPSANGQVLLHLTTFPALTSLILPFSGSNTQPHFDIDSGISLVLNLTAATRVEGYLKYRNEHASGI
jgi:hypothetical protein